MKNTDLMIGDWVQHGEGVCKVVSIAGRGIFFEDSISEGVATFDMINPIPLTPEILEKNGFSGEGYNMGIVGFSVEPIPDEKDGYEVFIWTDMCLQIKHGFTHFKKYIKYVHELQHALRICGIEKEITL